MWDVGCDRKGTKKYLYSRESDQVRKNASRRAGLPLVVRFLLPSRQKKVSTRSTNKLGFIGIVFAFDVEKMKRGQMVTNGLTNGDK